MIDRSQQPPLYDLEEFRLAKPQTCVLPNGVKLYMFDNDDVEVTRIDLVFNAGRAHQSQLLQALFTNRMLREGTLQLSRAQIAERLDFYGAWMEQHVSFHHSFFTLYTLNKYLAPTIELLSQMVKQPAFDAQVLEVVKQNNLQRHLVALQQPNAQARRMFLREIYSTDHVMGQLAEAIDYQAVNADMLKSYHKQWYHHRNVTVYMAGHITQECLDLVTQAFGEPFGEIPQGGEVHFAPVPQRPAKQLFKEMPGKAQSSVLIGKSTIGLHHPDCMQLRVLITLLGGFFGSRLMSTVREEKGLTYGIYAVLNPSPYDNALMILSDCDHRFVQPLLSETYHQIDRLQNELVSDDELALVRSTMKGELMRTYDSRLSLNDAWIYLHTQGLPDDYFHRYWQAISNVTSEDLQRLAGTYLGKDTLTEIVVGEKMS